MSALPERTLAENAPETAQAEGRRISTQHLEWHLGPGLAAFAAGSGEVRSLQIVVPGLALDHASVEVLLEGMDRLPALTSVTLSGDAPGDATKDIEPLVALHRGCAAKGLSCCVELRLDTAADPLGMLSRRSNSLGPQLETTSNLRLRGVAVRWLIPLIPELVFRLEAIFSLARDETADALLLGPERAVPLSPDESLFAWDFVTYRLLEEEGGSLSPERARYYRDLQTLLFAGGTQESKAEIPVTVLTADGGMRQESRCDEAAALRFPAPDRVVEEAPEASQLAEVGGVLMEGQSALLQWALAQMRPRPKGETLPTVMVIGAYGGEHIGDIAILGGVLFRVHRKLGATRAILMSQRPNHTRHLVPMLDVPVELSVETYDQEKIREVLPQVDGIVYAGGPLMDLPKQLVKHLYAVALARRGGKPFHVEGIGSGPFKRWPSEWTARRLIKMAEDVTLRTSDDGKHRLVRGLGAKVGRDPAFDYLETRGPELTRLPERDRTSIERLLEGTEGRTTVGINIRPIHSLFTLGASASRRAEYTRFIESRFEERFAEGLRRFKPEGGGKPCFIFFPMNAIQFGSPDLRSAYRIARILRRDVDFRIWEDDASLDGVVALLRRMDLVIAMRFHAAIFALSQNRRTIGIDYRVGGRDKVAALLGDFGHSENCCRIDTVTSDWLAGRLTDLAGPVAEQGAKQGET